MFDEMTEEERKKEDERIAEKKRRRRIYNQRYLEKNKEKVLKQKRDKYYENLEVNREKGRLYARKHYAKKQKEWGIGGKYKCSHRARIYMVKVEGEAVKVPMYTIGKLARVTNRKTVTVIDWERNKIIPQAMYRSPIGDRLYTQLQIDFIEQALKDAEATGLRLGKTNFTKSIFQLWEDYPLGIDINKVEE